MTKVYCFSATGRTLGLARALAQKLSCGLEELPIQRRTEPPDCQTAVVVFPVYCQSVPLPVKRCLPLITAENMVLIAVYGRKSCGNALHEAAGLTGSRVIAGAYVPTGHTYLDEPAETDLALLEPVLARIAQPCAVRIPWRFKNPFAIVFPRLRARVGVRIHVSEFCAHCGVCMAHCPMQAMRWGRPGRNCIRCLRCVCVCPHHALYSSFHPWLMQYLRGKKSDRTLLYL